MRSRRPANSSRETDRQMTPGLAESTASDFGGALLTGARCEEREIVEGGSKGSFFCGTAIISGSSGGAPASRRYAMQGRSSQLRWLSGGS